MLGMEPHHGKLTPLFVTCKHSNSAGEQRNIVMTLVSNAIWCKYGRIASSQLNSKVESKWEQGEAEAITADLLDFAVLHGLPGLQPARNRRHAAVLLPHVSLITRLEQHHILHERKSKVHLYKSVSKVALHLIVKHAIAQGRPLWRTCFINACRTRSCTVLKLLL